MVAAWLWLAAEAEEAEEKHRSLNEVLDIDPDNSEAVLALAVLYTAKVDD